jgi:hypothetical protein
VVSHELEIDVRALSYLVTVVIHRLHDIDPAWCRDLLAELKTDRMAASAGSDKLFLRAIGIVEQTIAGEAPPEKPRKSAVARPLIVRITIAGAFLALNCENRPDACGT